MSATKTGPSPSAKATFAAAAVMTGAALGTLRATVVLPTADWGPSRRVQSI